VTDLPSPGESMVLTVPTDVSPSLLSAHPGTYNYNVVVENGGISAKKIDTIIETVGGHRYQSSRHSVEGNVLALNSRKWPAMLGQSPFKHWFNTG